MLELVQFDERPAQRDSRREIRGVKREPGATHLDRLRQLVRATKFFGKLRKRNRRRVLLDPASKVFDPLIVGHPLYGTVTDVWKVPVRPTLSVTVRRTVYVPAAANEWLVTDPDSVPDDVPSPNDHW